MFLAGHSRLSPSVKCGIFKGTDRTFFVDRREFNSPVQDQIESPVQYVLEKINMGARFHGAYREDVYEIPPDSIRELIVNAVVHRNYINADASPITIALYDNRLEVTSPGGLVKGMTLAKMKNGYSECRNKALAAAFAYMNLIENWGSGVKRYIREIREAGLREPEFIEWPNTIRVNVYRTRVENAGESKGERRAKTGMKAGMKSGMKAGMKTSDFILSLMKELPQISVVEIAKRTQRAKSTIIEQVANLKAKGRIRRIGPDKGGYWEVVD